MSDGLTRRQFVGALALGAAAVKAHAAVEAPRGSKREAMLAFRNGGPGPGSVPAAFFLHFDEAAKLGPAAVKKHLEYFRFTGMDFVKVQFEQRFPELPQIRSAADWKAVVRRGVDFFRPQLEVVDGLVKAASREALVLVTLYSPFMCAGQARTREVLARAIEADGEAVRPALENVTESLLAFVRECRNLGVDGFYASTQGGEAGTFKDPALFQKYVKPYDLRLMRQIDADFKLNILHVCDYEAPYADYSPFVDYPGTIVGCNPRLSTGHSSLRELAKLFRRPIMGGLERKGVIATGSEDEVRRAAEAVLRDAPERFVLGADCTVPSETRWENLRAAIATAHAFKRNG